MTEILIVAAYLVVGYFVVGLSGKQSPATALLVSVLWPFVLAMAAGLMARDRLTKQ